MAGQHFFLGFCEDAGDRSLSPQVLLEVRVLPRDAFRTEVGAPLAVHTRGSVGTLEFVVFSTCVTDFTFFSDIWDIRPVVVFTQVAH